MDNWVILLAVSFILPLTYALFRWLVPYSPPPAVSAEELQRLVKQSTRIDLILAFPFLVSAAGCTAAWTALLAGAAHLRDRLMPPYLLLVKYEPDWTLWVVPSIFLGIVSGGWLVILGAQLVMGPNEYRDYMIATKAKVGFDSVRVWNWLTAFLVAGATILCVLAMDWYTRFEEKQIVLNPFWGFGEEKRGYDRVRQLVETTHFVAPNGNVVERTRQFVIFDEGKQWCHDDKRRSPQPLLDLLTRKTGKQVVRVRFLEDALKP